MKLPDASVTSSDPLPGREAPPTPCLPAEALDDAASQAAETQPGYYVHRWPAATSPDSPLPRSPEHS